VTRQYKDPTANILALLRDLLYAMEKDGSQVSNFTLKRYERDPYTNRVVTIEEHVTLVDLLSLPPHVVAAALAGKQSKLERSDACNIVKKKLRTITTYLSNHSETEEQ
jgi:hypothetical protein